MTTPGRESGQVTVLVLGLALVVFAVAGLAVDGTRAFLARRSLQNAADAAALAGASELDKEAFYVTGGDRLELDAHAAGELAGHYVADRGIGTLVAVETNADSIRVVLRDEVKTSFLGLVGIDRLPLAVEARAEPISGATP